MLERTLPDILQRAQIDENVCAQSFILSPDENRQGLRGDLEAYPFEWL